MARLTIDTKSVGPILFRVPDQLADVASIRGGLSVLPQIPAKGYEPTEKDLLDLLAFANPLIVRCAIRPKVIAENPAVIPEGCVPVAEIDSLERLACMTRLLRAGRADDEAAEAIRPTSETETGSSASTVSHNVTADDLPISQTAVVV